MYTRHPVRAHLEVNFRQSVIIAKLWRPEVERSVNCLSNFCVFLEKRPIMVNISKLCSESLHGDSDWRCCVQMSSNLSDGKSVKSCVIYRTKRNKISFPSKTVATARIAPNICQGQPPTFSLHYSRFHPNRFTFGGVIAKRVKTVFAT